MIAKLGSWIREFTEDETAAPVGDVEWATVMASLMVEAAMADGELDDGERAQITRILSAQPYIDAGAVDGLIDTALSWHSERVEIHALTRSIRAETDADDRIAIIEMAWMVVLADGELHEYESQLMRRLAGLLYVDDVESGRAAKRARMRIGNMG
ncbi:MAG: TerB family tellurite resistance protein [Pseudomonadota bacterium]|nr:TerB family tellurite resistance protein [Pseudomonadota bacterium]